MKLMVVMFQAGFRNKDKVYELHCNLYSVLPTTLESAIYHCTQK